MRSLKKILSNQSGQMMVVVMIATAFAGMYGAWSYLQNMQQTSKGVKSSIALNEVATSVIIRVQSLLAQNSLTGACAPFNTALSPFRNFGTPLTVTQNPTTFTYPPTAGSPDPTGCLLKSGEIAPATGVGGPVANMTVTVQQNGAPDLVGLSSSVGISVTASTASGAAGFHTVTLSSRLVLKVSTLSSYGLILIGPPSNVPQLTITDATHLEVMGSTLYADTALTTPLPLGNLSATGVINVPQGQVVFDQHFDIQVPSFVYLNTSSTSIQLDLSLMNQVFKGGVNTNVMSNAPSLPIDDPGPAPTLTAAGAWEQNLDFASLPGSVIPDITGLVTSMVPPVMWGTGAGGVVPTFGTPTYNAANTSFTGWSGSHFSTTPNTIPMPGSTATPTPVPTTLDSTCQPAASGSNPPVFVFTRINDNLSIDFTGTSSSAKPTGYTSPTVLGLPVFCGMIAANNLNIYAPAGDTYWIFGLIIAKTVTLSGGGSVIFVNPLDGTPLASNPFASTAGATIAQTESGLTQEMSLLAASIAHNFFVPVFQSLPPDAPAIHAYRPHSPLRETNCCGTTNTTLGLDTIDEVGYVCPCANSAPSTCSATGASAAPATDNNYCLTSGGTALPTNLDNQNTLFSTSAVWQNLSYTANIVQ